MSGLGADLAGEHPRWQRVREVYTPLQRGVKVVHLFDGAGVHDSGHLDAPAGYFPGHGTNADLASGVRLVHAARVRSTVLGVSRKDCNMAILMNGVFAKQTICLSFRDQHAVSRVNS